MTGTSRKARRAALLGAIATLAMSGSAAAVAARSPSAQTARTVNVVEHGKLQLVSKSGSTVRLRGTATGTLPGTVTARFETAVTTVTGTVTIRPRNGGSLTFKVAGRALSAGTDARFQGTLAVRRGTGRYRDAVGGGTWTGTVNRRTWDAVVDARARLMY